MQRIRLIALTSVITALAVFALGGGTVTEALNKVQEVLVTNTADAPVPVTGAVAVAGTVSVDNLPATQQVSGTVNVGNFPVAGAPPAATKTFSIPVQSLIAGENYTFLGVFTTASLLTIVTDTPVEMTFNGPAPVLVATNYSTTVPLTQRIEVNSVNVACKATSGSCRFRFFVVGD